MKIYISPLFGFFSIDGLFDQYFMSKKCHMIVIWDRHTKPIWVQHINDRIYQIYSPSKSSYLKCIKIKVYLDLILLSPSRLTTSLVMSSGSSIFGSAAIASWTIVRPLERCIDGSKHECFFWRLSQNNKDAERQSIILESGFYGRYIRFQLNRVLTKFRCW